MKRCTISNIQIQLKFAHHRVLQMSTTLSRGQPSNSTKLVRHLANTFNETLYLEADRRKYSVNLPMSYIQYLQSQTKSIETEAILQLKKHFLIAYILVNKFFQKLMFDL